MNYAELKAATLADTLAEAHEDLIARKINAAVKFISLSGKYQMDTMEAILGVADGVNDAAHVQTITVPARFRSVAYLRNLACPGMKFRHYDIEELAARPDAQNVNYVSMGLLHIRHSVLTSEFTWGYYTYPAHLVADTDENWITEMVPELVIDYTAAMVLNQLGSKETSKLITDFSRQNLSIFMKDVMNTGTKIV